MGTLATLALSVGLLTVAATPASAAAMRCNHDNGVSFNACLTLEYAGNGRFDIEVGFDRYMPRSYADGILACPGRGNFFSVVWGDDGGHPKDQLLTSLSLIDGFPSSGSNPDGIFAGFTGAARDIDEDDGVDEVYAEVTFFDCHIGQWFTYRTGTHRDTF